MDSAKTEKIGIILLAAGLSTRMGEPKQLLKIDGQPLIRLIARQALEARASETVVVIGHAADEIKKTLEDLTLKFAFNPHAEKGMGSSIKLGISFLKENHFSAGLIMTCDQPLIRSSHLTNIIESFHLKHRLVVASRYSGTVGIPALFDSKLFEQLLTIDDDQGAKKIVSKNISDALLIDLPEGNIDLDSPEDYRSYLHLIDKTNGL
jgi:molybdenum cofactor cytidylyltransferase